MQGSTLTMIILHVRIDNLCLCSCMNRRTVPKYTFSNRPGAKEVYSVLALMLVRQTGLFGVNGAWALYGLPSMSRP